MDDFFGGKLLCSSSMTLASEKETRKNRK